LLAPEFTLLLRLTMRLFSTSLLSLCSIALVLSKPINDQVSLQADDTARTLESWDYKVCSSPTDPIQIQSIEVSPDPPKPGSDLTVKVHAVVTAKIEDGAFADVDVKLGLIKLLHKRFDVCEEARNANATVQCPVEPGEYTVEQTVALPKEIPKAKFTVDVKGYTATEDDMVCVQLKVDFLPKFPRLW